MSFLKNFCSYICNKKIILFAMVLFLYSYEPSDGSIVEYLMIRKFHVPPATFAFSDMVAYVSLMLSSITFNRYLRFANTYHIIIVTNVIAFVIIISRNLFITDVLKIPPSFFLYLNSFIGAFIGQIGFLPFIILSTQLSPVGMEGTVYSFFMAVSNAASIISRELSGIFTNTFNIKNSIKFEIANMNHFYILCIMLDLLGLIGVLVLLKYILPITTAPTDPNTNDLYENDEMKGHPLSLEEEEELSGVQLSVVELNDSEI